MEKLTFMFKCSFIFLYMKNLVGILKKKFIDLHHVHFNVVYDLDLCSVKVVMRLPFFKAMKGCVIASGPNIRRLESGRQIIRN